MASASGRPLKDPIWRINEASCGAQGGKVMHLMRDDQRDFDTVQANLSNPLSGSQA